jgi:hypothetical protein
MDGLQGAVQLQGVAHLAQGHVGLLGQHGAQLTAVGGNQKRLASGKPVPRSNVPSALSLSQQLLDQSQGHPETAGNVLSGPILIIVSSQNPFPQIQGGRSHAQETYQNPLKTATLFIEML